MHHMHQMCFRGCCLIPCSCRAVPCIYVCFDLQDKVLTRCTGCRDWYS